jgi:uncharacterized protein YndB with AHSA1/START domain
VEVVRRTGREKSHYLDSGPITAIADRWINRYHRHRTRVLADLKFALESSVTDTEFVYTTYIRTTVEPRSTVTFDLQPAEDGVVKLTVIHGRLDPNGILRDMISGGWPRLLSDLKTLLETGRTLTATT